MDIQTEEIKCYDSYTSMRKAKIDVAVLSSFPAAHFSADADRRVAALRPRESRRRGSEGARRVSAEDGPADFRVHRGKQHAHGTAK